MSHDDRRPLPYISPEILSRDGFLEETVYPDRDINYYWSDRWDPAFYIHLARAGFITVAMDHEQLGPLLIPEMQTDYAVLDWKKLHISRHIQKILNRGSLEDQGFSLHIGNDPRRVIKAIRNQFGEENWLSSRYGQMLTDLCFFPCHESHFRLKVVELYEKGEAVAGEIGYTIGRSYTSLTGYSSRLKQHRNRGTLQLVLLARHLEKEGYAFWNLGHPYMNYKTALGAEILKREEFLRRWLKAVYG
ncbi:MAG: GNAT family N-acetyltransferase [Spirochaetales bacterium]|nr:GNAT family N-acetyltransferase [Spirochaetales bacterium]